MQNVRLDRKTADDKCLVTFLSFLNIGGRNAQPPLEA